MLQSKWKGRRGRGLVDGGGGGGGGVWLLQLVQDLSIAVHACMCVCVHLLPGGTFAHQSVEFAHTKRRLSSGFQEEKGHN